jgi:hypothetical protein
VNRARTRVSLLIACLVATVSVAGAPVAGAAEANPSGPGTLRLEVVGVGFDRGDGLPPPPAAFSVRNVLDGAILATPGTAQLAETGGGPCPGVGALCTGDVALTVLTLGTELQVAATQGPADRLVVYSGDCDGSATSQNATAGRVRLAAGETKVCRITFLRPDAGGVSDADTGLLVRTSFDIDQSGRTRPDQQLALRGASTTIASSSLQQLTDVSNPTARCPLSAPRPQCEWAVVFDQDDHALPFQVQESADPAVLPIFGGACDARGILPVDRALGGELLRCDVENVHLERADGSGRNAVVRVEVVGPSGTVTPTEARLELRSSLGESLAPIDTLEMATATGAPCPTVAGSVCSGDVGLTVQPARGVTTERFTIHLAPSASTAVPSFAGACATRTPQTGLPFGEIDLGVGALATCRVTLTPPPPPPPPPPPLPVLTIGDLRVGEGNIGTVAAGARVAMSTTASQPVTVSVSTANGTAAAPGDFSPVSSTATIPAGQTSVVVPVPIVGDVLGEPDETFTVRLASPTGATIGDATAVVTIVNDDDRTPPVLTAKATVTAEAKVAPVTVVYTAPSATDAVDGRVTATCAATSGSPFVMGTTTVTCSAVDRNGNTATTTFSVVVRLPTTTGAVTRPGTQFTDPLQEVTRRQRVQVDAGGFDPRSRVELVHITAAGEQIPLGRARVDRTGRIDRVVRIPRVPLGDGQLTAIGSAADGTPMLRAWRLTVVAPTGSDRQR